ncbi:MAG: class II histone deacetylase [Gammaproteobacteria bacterium]
MAGKTAFFHDERCLWHSTAGLFSLFLPVGGWVQPPAGAGLAESPETKRRIVSLLQVSKLADQIAMAAAPSATNEDLLRIHPAAYLDEFKTLSDGNGGELGMVAPFGPGSFEIAKVSAGLTIGAVDHVLNGTYANAYVMSRPPGHHCLPHEPMGFCLLANIAIGVEAAFANHAIKRVAVLDWDVHHGNGTQACFYDRDDVLTISIHQEGCFPPGYSGAEERGVGAGEGFNINVPLLPGGGHDAYLYAMEKIVKPAIDDFSPDLIVVACGFDANAVDPLARMLAHSGTFAALTHKVKTLADQHCDGKLVLVHEGGYAESCVPFCAHAVLEELSGVQSDVVDPTLEMFEAWQPNRRVVDLQREMIDELATDIFSGNN